MYLKKIELYGFKSFADKTELYFEKGITGIVGPNGCGKSNISDAIRWCLGENRTGVFRIKQMSDIIFGGTQTRAATGMAEVSLFFDNSQNVLPIDYSEVVITRKAFKNGENEYYINRSRCRLKDIRDLFLDTGIGFDGYSIIEQGRVDFLTSAKPEDRRDFFEDVAGVAKYRARREETIKRLEKVEQDLERLKDTMDIWQEQLSSYEKAAKKAQAARKYKENLEKYEIASLVRQISYGISEIGALKNNLEPKEKETQISKTTLAKLGAEITDIRMELDAKNEQYLNFNQTLGDISSKIAVSDEILRHNSQREEEIKQEQENLSKELEENKNRIIQYESQLNSFDGGDSQLPVEVENLEQIFKAKEQELNSIKSVIIQAQTQQENINAQLDDLDAQTESLVKEREQISEQHIHLQTEIAALERLISRLESEIEPSNNEISNTKQEIENIKQELNSHNLKKESMDKDILKQETLSDKLKAELSDIRETIIANESKIETLKDYDKKDPVRSAIKSLINLSMAKGPISALISADLDKEEVIAAALGEKLNYLICDNISDAEKAVKFLSENNLPRLSFIIADKANALVGEQNLSMPPDSYELIKILKFKGEYENIIKFVCSGAIVSDNKIYSQALVCGGAKTPGADTLLLEEKINKMQEENLKLTSQTQTIQTQIDDLAQTITDIRIERDKLSNGTIRLTAQIEAKTSLLDEKYGDIKMSTDEIDKHKSELQTAQGKFEVLDKQIDKIEEELTRLSNSEDAMENQLDIVEADISVSSAKEDEITLSLMQAKSTLDTKTAELNNKREGRSYLEENISNIKRQIESDQKRIDENISRLVEIRSEQETETIKIQDFHEQRARQESQIRVLLAEKESFQNLIDEKENEYNRLTDLSAELTAETGAMQSDIKNFEFQRDNLIARLSESYGKNYDEIKEEFINIEADQEEINRIKRKIESLGDINWSAQKEYEDLEQRRAFYDSQSSDLLKSKDDLLEAIKKLNNMTIESFKKTYDIVRENFKTVYRKLFGGGEADLILTDEENLLESGIDIFAQPPGKKLINISLYSGGERALTAIALLFAFFMVKASPFCVLDEVDGPLDDANLGRFIDMIKDFSKNTQFLTATHHKRTMEAADILHGVTMEERGVSKIISHRIKQLQEA